MQPQTRPLKLNPASMAALFKRQFELCKIKKGETIAIISDLGTRREYIQAAFGAASELGADIYEMCVNCVPTWVDVGVPTIGQCKGTLEAISAADMILIFHVPLFSEWLPKVQAKGVRVQMIIDAPDDLSDLQSPPGLKEALLHAHGLLENAREVRVTSKAGTDLTYRVGQYKTMSQYGFADEPGHFDHWGVGLVHNSPDEGSAQGVVVIQPGDIVILPYCRYIRDTIHCEIRDGHITKITGDGMDALMMRDWLTENKLSPDDQDPFALSHLGWGMHPNCRWDSIAMYGDSPERSRAAARSFPGNFLFSTGPNTISGGARTTSGHYDVPMRHCTIALDGNVIVQDGNIVDSKMIVAPTSSGTTKHMER